MVSLLADALLARGFAVHLISWDEPGANAFYNLSAQVKWHRLDFHAGIADKLRRICAVVKVLRSHRIRVLVGFVMSGDKTIFAAAKLAAVQLIAAERNAPAIYQLRYGALERWLSFACLHLTDRIAVQLPGFVASYPRTLQDRIEVIPNPVPLALRRARTQQPSSSGRFTLLSVSRLDRRQKRVHKLVSAFARIADRQSAWDLRVIGDGPEDTELRQLTCRLGLSARVRFERSTRNIFQAYADSHLFAIPSRWEGFPNALAEALAHGLPAIGFSEAPGVAELIGNGKNGWLADGSGDEAILANVLDEAMSDADERARRAANAVSSMAAYPAEPLFDRWAKLIQSLCQDLEWAH
jgi:glycosyltransferase involved in cell wall biosynthesis